MVNDVLLCLPQSAHLMRLYVDVSDVKLLGRVRHPIKAVDPLSDGLIALLRADVDKTHSCYEV